GQKEIFAARRRRQRGIPWCVDSIGITILAMLNRSLYQRLSINDWEDRMVHRGRLLAALIASLCVVCQPAVAEDYPARLVTLVVPFPAGGGVDTVGRVIAQKLTEALGQQVIVENRPGAGSVIGARSVARATSDGYTLLMMVTGLGVPSDTGYDVAK